MKTSVPIPKTLLSVTMLTVHCAGSLAVAAEEPAADSQAPLDTIVIVSSRSGNATVLNSVAPVQVVSGTELFETGARTLSEALLSSVPSFNFPTSAPSSNAASFVKGVALRGLATDQTLVLVNGKRRHATAQLNAASGVSMGA